MMFEDDEFNPATQTHHASQERSYCATLGRNSWSAWMIYIPKHFLKNFTPKIWFIVFFFYVIRDSSPLVWNLLGVSIPAGGCIGFW